MVRPAQHLRRHQPPSTPDIDSKDNHTLTLRLWQFKHEYVGRIFFRVPALDVADGSSWSLLAPPSEDIVY